MVDNVTKLNAIKISLYVKLWFSVYWVDYGHIWFDIIYAGVLWAKTLYPEKKSSPKIFNIWMVAMLEGIVYRVRSNKGGDYQRFEMIISGLQPLFRKV